MTPPIHDDLLLARRVARGEEAAYDELFRLVAPPLLRFAQAQLGGDRDAAADVLQETLVKGLLKIRRYRGRSSLFTWLCTFLRHEVSRHYRRARRRPVTFGLHADLPALDEVLERSVGVGSGSPEERIQSDEVAALVRATLAAVPTRYRRALELKYVEECSVAEVGRHLGVGEIAAQSLLARARRAFREAFRGIAPRPWALALSAGAGEGDVQWRENETTTSERATDPGRR